MWQNPSKKVFPVGKEFAPLKYFFRKNREKDGKQKLKIVELPDNFTDKMVLSLGENFSFGVNYFLKEKTRMKGRGTTRRPLIG